MALLEQTTEWRQREVSVAFELFRQAELSSRYYGRVAKRVARLNNALQMIGGLLATVALAIQSSDFATYFQRTPWLRPSIIIVGTLGALSAALFPLLSRSGDLVKSEALAKEYGRVASLLRDLIHNLGRLEMSESREFAAELAARAKVLSELLSRMRDADDIDPNERILFDVSTAVEKAFPPSLAWRWYGFWPEEIPEDETNVVANSGKQVLESPSSKWIPFGTKK
jgi:hypothetical protein